MLIGELKKTRFDVYDFLFFFRKTYQILSIFLAAPQHTKQSMKDGFGRLLAALRERGLLNMLVDFCYEAVAYIRSYMQMVMEVVRNLRHHLLANGDDWFFTEPALPASPVSASGSPKNDRGRRRAVMAPVTSRMSAGKIPALEELDETKQKQELLEEHKQQAKAGAQEGNKENTRPLEPAFLRDEDYPPGWLVFDPHLGIISKVEADQYKQEQAKKRAELMRQQQQQQQHNTNEGKQQQQQQQMQPQQRGNEEWEAKSNNSRQNGPLRQSGNTRTNASTIHTPHTIAANG